MIFVSNKKSGLGKFLIGLGIGAGLGVLFAPKSGVETRKDLKNKMDEFIKALKDIDVAEVKEEFFNKLDEIKTELEDLDKEKVMRMAQDKAEVLKQKVSDLVELAKEKGTPVLEGIANDLRLKAIYVTKDVLKKLENK